MATVLGKRKSRTQKDGPSISPEEAQAKLARFFEAEFKPLIPTTKSTPTPAPETAAVESDSDSDADAGSWDGFSEDEAEDGAEDGDSSTPPTVIEVVSHTEAYATTTTTNALDRRESRAWLSSRPPLATEASSFSTSKKGKTATAEEDAPSLLKNDLALQRLLAESHLFSSAAAKSGGGSRDGDPGTNNTTEHVGRNRHLATDLRLSALGSKASIYRQEKMPMAFRKGIQAAAEGREAKRRREARENGIVLERPGGGGGALGKKGVVAGKKRKGPSRAVDAPAVGRLNGGMLRLGKRDIADIEGGGPRSGGGGGAFTKKRRRR
ncbi:hypothetical protein F4859DRAFT_474623 [Xylaria cf. heliscus]|nr:hypothetical protein F4859DRAFT_474623 [Xylaria cf. heliscus]